MIVNARHGRFHVDPRDKFIAQKLICDGVYSESELEILLTCVKPDRDVVIVGAHIGSLAIPISLHCRTLLAVEANPYTFGMLADNVKLNGRSNIIPLCAAADVETGRQLNFLCGTVNSGGSKRMPKTLRGDYIMDDPERVKVKTVKLDDVCGLLQPSLVHMDIEGSEVFAMRGAPWLLAATEYLSIEFISHHLTDVAGVTVDEWLAPIEEAGFNKVMLPGDATLNRPTLAIEPEDWRPMLQSIVDAGVGIENLIFWRA